MSIDKGKIESKIDIIDRNLNFLTEYDNIDENEYLNSYKDIQAVKHSLFEIIESCIDISSHVISIKKFERAESYSEMFEILGKNSILDHSLAERLSDMARFRNVLVHGYSKIDNIRVLSYVRNNLKDVKEFISVILQLIDTITNKEK